MLNWVENEKFYDLGARITTSQKKNNNNNNNKDIIFSV